MATKTAKTSVGKGRENRPVWRGFLKFGLVSIPVNAYPAANNRGNIELHWLHKTCHQRIHQQKVCPTHGEVPTEEVVSGYKYGKDKYIVIDPDDIKKLHAKSDETIEVRTIVTPGDIDAIYYTDKTYYLLPVGDAGGGPYAVFQEAMSRQSCWGIAEAVIFQREHLMLVRPLEGLLVVTFLTYPDRLQSPNRFASRLPKQNLPLRELEMAKTLLTQYVDVDFDIHQYHDRHAEMLMKLINAKAKGQKIEPPEEETESAELGFTDALKKSLRKGAKLRPSRRRRPAHTAKRRAS